MNVPRNAGFPREVIYMTITRACPPGAPAGKGSPIGECHVQLVPIGAEP
jgi:hypothetical protein